ncbi:MAG: hypothetical protein KIS62_01315 [Ramlibacter sp.]|nr:hypothetical protein [Ramlibacter sp.]
MARAEPNLLTQAEYARHRKALKLSGGSREAVRKAVDEGRITTFGSDKRIHAELADIEWERNTRTRLSPQAQAAPLANASAAPELDLQPAPGGVPNSAASPAAPPAASPVVDGYTAARARREVAEAAMAEMQHRKLRGELVATADVAKAAFETARDLRDALESSVNPLAAELAPVMTADECAQILRKHNRAIQELLAKSCREKLGQQVGDID